MVPQDRLLRIMELLQIDIADGRIKIAGRSITLADLPRIYQRQLGMTYAAHPDYLKPSMLWGALLELSETLQAVDREEKRGKFPINDIESFIQQEKNNLSIEISPAGIWSYRLAGKKMDYSREAFLSHLKSTASVYNSYLPKDTFKIPVDQLGNALVCHMVRIKDTRKQELRRLLAYRPNAESPDAAIAWLFSIYFIDVSPANIAAFKHLLWSVKRGLWDLEVSRPLFFSLHCAQQAVGKTEFLKRLCTGFEWVYSGNGALRSLLDENNTKSMLRDYLLIDFQELSLGSLRDAKTGSIDDSVIAKLKAAITSTTIGGRIMYDSGNGIEAKRAVFTSSTNKHVWEVISDTTGMRRYWEFDMHVPPLKERQEAGTTEFYLAANEFFDSIAEIYQGIDENNEKGFYGPHAPEWREMTEIQMSYIRSNQLLRFIDRKGWKFLRKQEPGAIVLPLSGLVQQFNDYLFDNAQGEWKGTTVIYTIRDHFEISPETCLVNGRSKEVYYVKEEKK